jgi:hypothetical protein
MLHCGAIRQTVRITGIDHDQGVLRTGDRATVQFEFISNPEFIRPGWKLLFREGKTKVCLYRICVDYPLTSASGAWRCHTVVMRPMFIDCPFAPMLYYQRGTELYSTCTRDSLHCNCICAHSPASGGMMHARLQSCR